MTSKVFKLELVQIPSTDSAGKPIDDPIGTRINKIYADPSMAGFSLVAAYETTLGTAANPTPSAPTHLMLYFQKP
jgi:hypothetical protein